MADQPERGVVAALEHVSKSFGSTRALVDVSIELHEGEVLAIAGENGAGKSTVLNILTGVVGPDDGVVRIQGEAVQLADASDALQHGLFRWFQHPVIIPDLPVYENIYLGFHHLFRIGGMLQRSRMRAAAAGIAGDVLGQPDLVSRTVRSLPYTTLELLQLVRLEALIALLEVEKPVLLLDEPTAALSEEQSELMFERLGRLFADGASAIYVSHRMAELQRLGTRGYVLKDGSVAGAVDRDQLGRPDVLHTLMVGRAMETDYFLTADRVGAAPDAEPAWAVRQTALSAGGAPFDLTGHPGEIVGIAGVEGSGKERLGRILAGVDVTDRGQVVVAGSDVTAGGARRCLKAGAALLPVDRHREGVILQHTIADNIRLGSLYKSGSHRSVSKDAINSLMSRLRVKAPGQDTRVDELSGGNQQKVVIAKWLAAGVTTLVAENPTQGVDIGARHDCYQAFRDFAAAGGSIVLVSDDTPELLGLSDRCVVFRDNELVGELDLTDGSDSATHEANLVRLMVQ